MEPGWSLKINNSFLLCLLLMLSCGEFYLEFAVTSCSSNLIQSVHKKTHMVYFRRHLQMTNPLSTPLGILVREVRLP